MPKRAQSRDIDDEVHSKVLRIEAGQLASRPSVGSWLAQTRRRTSAVSTADIRDALDENRGVWPGTGR